MCMCMCMWGGGGVGTGVFVWIRQLLDDTRTLLGEALPRITRTTVVGMAEVLARFELGRGAAGPASGGPSAGGGSGGAGAAAAAPAVAGCRVKDGSLARNGTYRVIRQGKQVFEGTHTASATERQAQTLSSRGAVAGRAASLRVVKKDVDAVAKGHECGLILEVRWPRAPRGAHACVCCMFMCVRMYVV
jgi:translation initiation factor IF-2